MKLVTLFTKPLLLIPGTPSPMPFEEESNLASQSRGNIKKAHYGLWLGLNLMTSVLLVSGGSFMLSDHEDKFPYSGIVLLLLAVAFALWLGILSLFYIHRMWRLIPPAYARSTPGKAVGFLFIPFFNFYWIFQAYYGWSWDYNRFLNETGDSTRPRVPGGLFMASCILCVLCAIPGLNYVVMFPSAVLMFIAFYHICRAINGHRSAQV